MATNWDAYHVDNLGLPQHIRDILEAAGLLSIGDLKRYLSNLEGRTKLSGEQISLIKKGIKSLEA